MVSHNIGHYRNIETNKTFGGKKVTALLGLEKPIETLAGQYFDTETGLHYNYHRYYDPKAAKRNFKHSKNTNAEHYILVRLEGARCQRVQVPPGKLSVHPGSYPDSGLERSSC